MHIKWHGHASFRIKGDGVEIVTDPYTPEIAGYDPITEPADIVIMSSANDTFHSCATMVPGNPVVINALEITKTAAEVKGIRFSSVAAMESIQHKDNPDQNAMYRFEVEGIKVGHMGDVGNRLKDNQLRFFDGVDVLFALTGGPPTIELDHLDEVISSIQPKVTIPMHYRTPKVKLTRIHPLEDFTSRYPSQIIHYNPTAEAEFSSTELPSGHQIHVLNYTN